MRTRALGRIVCGTTTPSLVWHVHALRAGMIVRTNTHSLRTQRHARAKPWACHTRRAHTQCLSLTGHAFSLIELLISIAIVSVLISILLPALGTARSAARQSVCASNQRQLVLGWTLYAQDFDDRAMPLAYTSPNLIGSGDRIFWWGADGSTTGALNHSMGFLAPYLDASTSEHSVYECPSQPDGTYRRQGPTQEFTSTYGYNGYYLSPSATPGWSFSIGDRPWRRLSSIAGPSRLFVFGDTLLPGSPPSNNALLDPPMLYAGRGRWNRNNAPTTAFRHIASATNTGRADGSVRSTSAKQDWLTHPKLKIGSVGTNNDPHYVPDWRQWN